MNEAQNIQDELKSMGSILADLPRSMPYAVPVGYFENFAVTLRNTINELNEAEITPDWGKTLPYTVPGDYFEQLPEELAAKTFVTGTLPKAQPYAVPSGYFESLPAQMLQAAKATGNKVIPHPTRRTLPNPVKWLAAAILVIGLGIGSFRIYNMQQRSGTEKILSSVPNNEIQDYLQHMYRMDVNKVLQSNPVNNMNIDNNDIVQYLNETGWD